MTLRAAKADESGAGLDQLLGWRIYLGQEWQYLRDLVDVPPITDLIQ